jgi:hypothetical protein
LTVSQVPVENQIRAIEMQLKALRAQLQQETRHSTPVRALGDLRGVFKSVAHSTEQQIREAQMRWEWEEEDSCQE